ncbi:MAG: 6-bladed beta-propeller [Vicinamibacterales bacterium]
MKRTIQFLLAAGVVGTLGLTLGAQSVPELNYDGNVNLLQLPSFGEVAGVASNSKGNIYVYARTGHAVATLGDERTFYHLGSRVFQFDGMGKFVKEIAQGTYAVNFAQQVRVDPQDNVWIVDAGSNMVVKFDPNGKFVQVLGRKPESITTRPGPGVPASAPDLAFFNQRGPAEGGGGRGGQQNTGEGINGDNFSYPADVAWDAQGNIFVADGFGNNNRIAKFTKDSNFVKKWGRTGSGQGQFNGIRAMVNDKAGNLYVADAGNKRVQVFDSEGNFKSEIKGIGTPQALCMTQGATQYLFSSNSNDAESMDGGEIYKLTLDGKVVGKFGQAGRQAKQFGMTNSLDCRTDTELLVGEVWNWRVQKVSLK